MIETLSAETMKAMFDHHLLFEFNLDLDGVIGTMVVDPWYEVYPFGYTMQGREIVREWYRRMFAGVIPRVVDTDKVDERALAHGPSILVIEQRADMRMLDDSIHRCNAITVAEFRTDGVAGERLYLDEGYRQIFADVLGPDFADLPGVTKQY